MFDVVVFEGPDMLAEFGGDSVFSVTHSLIALTVQQPKQKM